MNNKTIITTQRNLKNENHTNNNYKNKTRIETKKTNNTMHAHTK